LLIIEKVSGKGFEARNLKVVSESGDWEMFEIEVGRILPGRLIETRPSQNSEPRQGSSQERKQKKKLRSPLIPIPEFLTWLFTGFRVRFHYGTHTACLGFSPVPVCRRMQGRRPDE